VKLGRTLLRERRYREAETEILAGSEILSKQTSPSVSWIQAARKDSGSRLRRPGRTRESQGSSSGTGRAGEIARATIQENYIIIDHAQTNAAVKKLERTVGKIWAKRKDVET
jgi:hypothetical protein